MPRDSFYPDLDQTGLKPVSELCYATIEMFDGPGICKRAKNHRVDQMEGRNVNSGEFHQEEYEGWVWDSNGSIW